MFSLPVGLKDVSTYQDLFAELVRRGWREDDLQKLAGRNLVRVFQQAELVCIFKTVLSSGYILILLSIENILASLIETCQRWSRMRNVK